eukprot:199026-Pleurochrysis_carterae.AAC.1
MSFRQGAACARHCLSRPLQSSLTMPGLTVLAAFAVLCRLPPVMMRGGYRCRVGCLAKLSSSLTLLPYLFLCHYSFLSHVSEHYVTLYQPFAMPAYARGFHCSEFRSASSKPRRALSMICSTAEFSHKRTGTTDSADAAEFALWSLSRSRNEMHASRCPPDAQ